MSYTVPRNIGEIAAFVGQHPGHLLQSAEADVPVAIVATRGIVSLGESTAKGAAPVAAVEMAIGFLLAPPGPMVEESAS